MLPHASDRLNCTSFDASRTARNGTPEKVENNLKEKCNEMKGLSKNRPVLRRKNRGGAPKGNRNALKTGLHTSECRARRAKVRLIVRRAREAIAYAFAATAREIREPR